MTDQQFVIDLGNEQRAVVEPDDAAWLQEKLRREPGSTRLEIRYDDADTEGHGGNNTKFKVIVDSDDDTEGHAIALNFPTREEADAFRKLVLACFGLRRKQIRRVLRTVRGLSAEEAEGVLQRVGIAPEARPETLAPDDFARLLRAL